MFLGYLQAFRREVAWEPILKMIPNGFRGIAYSERGYRGSIPLTEEEAGCIVPPSQRHRAHVADLAAFIEKTQGPKTIER